MGPCLTAVKKEMRLTARARVKRIGWVNLLYLGGCCCKCEGIGEN